MLLLPINWTSEKALYELTLAPTNSALIWCSPSLYEPRNTKLVFFTGCCRVADTPVSQAQPKAVAGLFQSRSSYGAEFGMEPQPAPPGKSRVLIPL